MMEKRTRILVRYADTDQMGVVHNANYLTYFEVARTEYLKDLYTSYKAVEEAGFMFPVTGANLSFIGNLKYDDEMVIVTRMQSFKGARFTMEYEIYVGDRLVHKATTGHAITDKNMRPVNIKKVYPALYEAFMKGLGQPV